MEILVFIFVLLLLLICGLHIGVALGASALIILVVFEGTSLNVVAQQTFNSANSYALAAIPFFILAGDLILKGGLAKKILDLTEIVAQKISGGTAMAAMLVSIFFSAVSGSSVASAAAVGKNLVLIMDERGYPKKFVAGLVATGGTLGLLIPPSLSFILIGSIIGIPVMDLFTAGIIPGVMQGIMLLIITWYICKKNNWEVKDTLMKTRDFAGERVSKVSAFASASGVIFLPFLILGGIYLGIFTPTEVSAVAVVYAAFISVIIYKSLKMGELWGISREALYQSGMIYLILIGGGLVSYMLKVTGLTNSIIQFIGDLGLSGWQFLIIVNILLLFIGLFLDGVTVISLVAPILFPIATALGIDPIHFAVIMTMNIEIATLTPPVGLNLFVMSGLTKLPIQDVAKGVGPYYIVMFVSLILVTYIPEIALLLIR